MVRRLEMRVLIRFLLVWVVMMVFMVFDMVGLWLVVSMRIIFKNLEVYGGRWWWNYSRDMILLILIFFLNMFEMGILV